MADLAKLDSVINDLEEQTNDLKEFNKLYSEIGKLKSDINDNLILLKENNVGFSTLSDSTQERLENFQNKLELIEAELLKKIQELYQDNKNFQKELDSTITSRLEKNKSDIQVEIRNEGTQIQRAFENTLTLSFNNMEAKLKDQFEVQTKQLNNLKIVLFVVIVIELGLVIGLYLK